MSPNVPQCRPMSPNHFFREGDVFLVLRFQFSDFGAPAKSLVRIGVPRSTGVLADGACYRSAIREGREFTAKGRVKSGQVRFNTFRLGQPFFSAEWRRQERPPPGCGCRGTGWFL